MIPQGLKIGIVVCSLISIDPIEGWGDARPPQTSCSVVVVIVAGVVLTPCWCIIVTSRVESSLWTPLIVIDIHVLLLILI